MKIAGIDIAPATLVWLGDEPVAAGHNAAAAALLEAGVQNHKSFSLTPEDTDAILQVLRSSRFSTIRPPLGRTPRQPEEVGGGVLNGLFS